MTSPREGGVGGWIRRASASFNEHPNEANIATLMAMGVSRSVASRQLHLSHGNVRQAQEALVHAAHPIPASGNVWDHPDCPVCVREANNVRIAEGRRQSFSDVLHRVTSGGRSHHNDSAISDEEGHERPAGFGRRGSVSAMLRRPSVADALKRMTTRDVK